jgi:hypothetical protein
MRYWRAKMSTAQLGSLCRAVIYRLLSLGVGRKPVAHRGKQLVLIARFTARNEALVLRGEENGLMLLELPVAADQGFC